MADIASIGGQATVRGSASFTVNVEATGENRRRKVASFSGIPQASGTAGAEVSGVAVALLGGAEAPYAANGGTLNVPRGRRFVGHNGFLAVLRAADDERDEKGSAYIPLGGGGTDSVADDSAKRYYPIGNETGDAIAVEYRLNPSTTDDTDELRIVHVGSLDARDSDEVVVDLFEAQSAPSEGTTISGNGLTHDQLQKLESIQTGAEVNVQADWDETDPNADGYIDNKPTLFDGDFHSLTNVPDTAEQWPDYTDVTGSKPPVNAQANPQDATQAEAETGTEPDARSFSPLRVRQAIAGWWATFATVAWNKLTSVPAFASRWPAWGEVTAKPDTATRWPAWGEVTGKPEVRNPGDAFVQGALTGATREKYQDLTNAIIEGGWDDVAGPVASVPSVRSTTKTTQFTASEITSGTYVQQGETGLILGVRYVGIRIPRDYDAGLPNLRLRVGVGEGGDAYTENDPVINTWSLLSGANVTHITSSANYRYYSIRVNIPAGGRWSLQENDPWELDETYLWTPKLTVQSNGETLGTAKHVNTLNIVGDNIDVSVEGDKATVTHPETPVRLFPASQPFTTNKEGRLQIEQHEVIRQQNRMVQFSAYTLQNYVPPGAGGVWDGVSTTGDSSVQIPGIGRLTYYPTTHYESALRGRFTFTPQSEYQRNFGANRLVVATAADNTNQETLVLTLQSHGRYVTTAASSANRILNTATAEQRQRWINFTNPSNNFEFVNQDDVLNRYLSLADFAKELGLRSAPTVESIARPAGGWPNSNVYVHGSNTPIPLRFNAGLDDALWFQVGFSGAPGYAIHGSHGIGAWSPWVKVQHAKQWTPIASPYSTGGENLAPRYYADEQTDYTRAVNAVRAVAHSRMELTARIGTDGYLRFHATDSWARLGSILVRYGYLPR